MAERTIDWSIGAATSGAIVLPNSNVAPLILQAAATYEQELRELLKMHSGRWIAYYGARRVAVADQEPDLLQACYERGYNDQDLYVRRIEEPISMSAEW